MGARTVTVALVLPRSLSAGRLPVIGAAIADASCVHRRPSTVAPSANARSPHPGPHGRPGRPRTPPRAISTFSFAVATEPNRHLLACRDATRRHASSAASCSPRCTASTSARSHVRTSPRRSPFVGPDGRAWTLDLAARRALPRRQPASRPARRGLHLPACVVTRLPLRRAVCHRPAGGSRASPPTASWGMRFELARARCLR